MFWIEKYRPQLLHEIRGQDAIIKILTACAEKKNIPHLLIIGPHGTGKSSGISAMLKQLYGQRWEEYTTIFPAADLFLRGKKYLEEDERFSHIYQKEKSFIANLKHAINWYAGMKPFDESFRVIIFEDADALSHDAQQALRRIMERYSETCRFIFITSHASALILPICSRCLPLYFSPLSHEVIKKQIMEICVAEKIGPEVLPEEDINLITVMAQGDLRKAIMYLQVMVATESDFDLSTLNESESGLIALAAFREMKDRNFSDAMKRIESLMIDLGLGGYEVLEELRSVVRREYNHPALACCLADADMMLIDAHDPYVHINALVSRIITEVFS